MKYSHFNFFRCDALTSLKTVLHQPFEDRFCFLLRQEYLPNLMSGEMLSHPVGRDKPILEVNLL